MSGTTSISGAGTQGISISGSTLNANFGTTTTVSGSTSQGILIGTSTVGTISFGNTAITGGTDGVSFQNNSSGSKTFGTLSVSGGSGIAFLHGAGGGNVTVTGAATLSSAGNAVDIQSAAASTAINFQGSVSATRTASGGTGVNLASNNATSTVTFNSLSITTNAGTGLSAAGGGTVNVTNGTGTINSTPQAAPAIIANGVTLNANFSAINSSGGTNGVSLTNVTGTSSFGNGSLTGASGAEFFVSGSNPIVTYGGTVTQNNAARVVDIQGTTGNSVSFTDAATGVTGGASSLGVHIGDTSAVNGNVSFVKLTLGTSGSRMTNQAITITNGTGTYSLGTVGIFTTGASGSGIAATNADGTLNTTTGTVDSIGAPAINIDGPAGLTTLGITLTKVSASGGSNGIIVQDTNGSFTVNGTGSAGTGGTIQNATVRGARFKNATNVSLNWMTFSGNGTNQGTCSDVGAVSTNNTDCGAGIDLQTVSTVSLVNTTVTGGTQQGINGNAVSTLTMTNVAVTGAGNEVFENGVTMVNLTGTCTVTNSNFTNSFSRQWEIQNYSGSMTMTVSGGSFSASAPNISTTAYGLHVSAQSTASNTVSVTGAMFANSFSSGFRADVANSASMNATIGNDANAALGNTFTNNGVAVHLLINNSSTLTYDVGRNTITETGVSSPGSTIIVRKGSSTSGLVTGSIVTNAIGDGNAGSGSGGTGCGSCNAISLQNDGTSGDFIATVIDNTIQHVRQRGIEVLPGFSDDTKVVIQHNNISNPDITSPNVVTVGEAIFVESGINSGDTTRVCATIGGSTADLKNTLSGTWASGTGNGGIRVRNRFTTTSFNLPGFGGTATTMSQVVTFIEGNNNMGGNVATATNAGGGTGFSGAACPFLMLAPGGVAADVISSSGLSEFFTPELTLSLLRLSVGRQQD
ncbi:MAG: hypothetical protein AUG51_03995 [Acidobacteria bacterium 13_1_20CM_3_53_8]|nr:MAG: hypothetical protein AUG51_03995 [Acidobacteria bacterium 13_1_20CM_3_53_8]